MSEEDKKDPVTPATDPEGEQEKKPDEFDDLPEDKPEGEPAEDIEKLKKELEAEREKKHQLEIAISKEREKSKGLKKTIKEKDEETPEPADVEKIVEAKLAEQKATDYEKSLRDQIRSRVKTKQEAELLLHYAKTLPEKSGDAVEDVERAVSWVEAMNARKSGGMPTPLSSGSSGFEGQSQPKGIPKSAIELGKNFGHTEEDFKKHDGEITF